jgi:hypothetical protein
VDLIRGAGGDKSVPYVALVMYYYRTSHRLAAHLYPVLLRTNSITIYVSVLCRIRYRFFPTKTPAFYCTVGSEPALYLYVIQCTA